MLDRLAKESVRYTHAFTTAPVCAPSRAAIITGMYQTAIGAQHMRTTEDRVPELPGPYLAVPPFYVKAFPEYLRAAGYYTTNRAKTDYQFGVPFTIWDDLGRTAHWRNRPDKSQPFFSVFNLEVTHESQIFPVEPGAQGQAARHRSGEDRGAAVLSGHAAGARRARAHVRQHRRHGRAGRRDAEAARRRRAGGQHDRLLLERPRRRRAAGEAIALRLGTARAADDPLAEDARRRTVAPGSVRDDLVSFIDLAPTVLALAGVDGSGHLAGARARRPAGQRRAPEFVFAARDRMDIEYDMMRSARDERFLYIRNFAPELPYAGHIIYRNQSAIMQEWFRLQAERKLTGPAALWMRTHRPAEELYDTIADPHQIRDLSAEPAHRATLVRMRQAVTDWMTRIGDQGLINEPEMIQRMWPGGVQPETAQPYILPRRTTDDPARQTSITIDGPTGDRHLRADAGRIDRLHHRGRDGAGVAALHRADPRRPADDAARQGDPLRLQGERRDARDVHEVAHSFGGWLCQRIWTIFQRPSNFASCM